MLHDYQESARDSCRGASPGPFHLVLSSHYWPVEWPETSGPASALELSVASMAKRQHQTLRRRRHLDRFDLTIDFDNGTFPFARVTYHQKCILDLLDAAKGPGSLSSLVDPSAPDRDELWDALQFWLKQRVLVLTPASEIVFASHHDPTAFFSDAIIQVGDRCEDTAASSKRAAAELVALDRHWPYILAMLTNLGPMKLERIHSTLAMFASDYKGPMALLEHFLNHRLQTGELLSSHGAYQACRK